MRGDVEVEGRCELFLLVNEKAFVLGKYTEVSGSIKLGKKLVRHC